MRPWHRRIWLGCGWALVLFANIAVAEVSGDSAAVRALLEEARSLEAKDLTAAQALAEKALALAQAGEDPALWARAENRLGAIFYRQASYQRARELFRASLVRARAAGDSEVVADALNNLGILFYLAGDWERALEYYRDALEIRKARGDRQGMAVAHNNLGNVAYAAERYPEALDYYRLSQGLYLEIGESRHLASSHNNVGLVHFKLGELAAARKAFEAAREVAQSREDPADLAMTADHLGMVDEAEGRLEAAHEAFRQAISLRRALGDTQGIAVSLINLASVEAKSGNDASAFRHLEESLGLAQELAVPELESEALAKRAEIYQKRGQWREAFADQAAFHTIRERIHTLRSNRQLAETRADFELAQKDLEIAALRREESFQRAWRWTLGGLSTLLLLVVALLWSRNRLQERSRREIEAKHQLLEEARQAVERAARNEMAHLARVAGLGEMTAAVAHELNQPLAAILTNSQIASTLLERRVHDVDVLVEVVEDITLGARRAWELLRHLRELARNGEIKKERVELGRLLDESLLIAGAEARLHQVVLQLERPATEIWIEGDRVHLQQVILNLLQNGIAVAASEAPEHRNLTLRACAEGGVVEVGARDQGRPVPAEVLDRMFEPFFTTKSDGLGMGLAICKRLIEALGGELWVRPNPDRGLTVGFRLQESSP